MARTTKQRKKEFYKDKRNSDARKIIAKLTKDEQIQKKNDVSWYTKFESLAKASGNIIYGQPMGEVLELGGRNPTSLGGIMKISLLPSIGISTDSSSPVNNMSRLVYSFIRHANSGSRNYEAPDYMTYCLAMGSAYAYFASLCRLYGVIRTYSTLNKFVAKATVEALNFDYDNIVNQLANLRYYINYFAARINTFAVPKDMTYYDRCAFLPLHVFKDNEGDKCSFYLFDYAKLFVWDGTTESTGSSLQPIDWGIKTGKTLDDIQEVGENIINSLLNNEDIGIMSGDTLKAYGSNGVRTVLGIEDSFAITPIYNHDMLWQIHNARIVDISSVLTDDKVVQRDGYLVFNPTITGYTGVNLGNKSLIMDSDLETPDYKFNLENSRLHVRYNSSMTKFIAVGTELPIKAEIYAFFGEGSNQDLESNAVTDVKFNGSTGVVDMAVVGVCYSSTFKLHPIWFVETKVGDNVYNYLPFADLHNYTQVSDLAIKQLHNAALLSLFAVPNAATAAK
uniref:Capsid protein n=1 Tax=Dromedary picobirnavirus TaxID=1574421 RepID=A0A0A1EIT1_9VIRU|nr:capsid protein [Dromedary picobirnavirus]